MTTLKKLTLSGEIFLVLAVLRHAAHGDVLAIALAVAVPTVAFAAGFLAAGTRRPAAR